MTEEYGLIVTSSVVDRPPFRDKESVILMPWTDSPVHSPTVCVLMNNLVS
jgi:hypothetical protein